MKNKRVARGKVGVAKGFGPRHAENSAEGQMPNTDTVPAMLTPREAVLNRNAAEMAGRGNIEKLNEEGNVLAQKGVDLAARGKTSVAPVALPKVPRVVASSNVLKYVPEGQIRREVAAAIPKGIAEGDDDVPANAWGPGSSLGDRLSHDFGRSAKEPFRPEVNAYQDLMHFLAQFGAPTENKSGGLGPAISNEEMMRRYPGLQLQEGEDDTPYPMRLPLEGADAARYDEQDARDALMLDLEMRMKDRGTPPLRQSKGDFNPRRALPSLQELNLNAQKGETNVKPKKMQSGGNVGMDKANAPLQGGGGMPGAGYWPGGMSPTGLMGGAPPQPGAGSGGDPMPGTGPMFPGSPAWVRTHPNYQAPDTSGMPGSGPMWVGSPQWRRTHPNYYGGTPGAGGGGPGLQGGGFYPPGQGFASGTPEVPETIGSPNTQQAYGPPITLSAPTLQRAAVQAGLNPGQIQGLMKAVQGVGQAYNSMGGGGAATDVSSGYYGLSQSPGGYQGGISDIGYPPMLMPGAQYHADKGSSWVGPYDPQYLVQRYMRGTGMVPGW